MSKRIDALKSLIYGNYKSEAELSKHLGWPRQRLNKITNGAKEPDIQELNELSIALNVGVEELLNIFLRKKSPIGQHTA